MIEIKLKKLASKQLDRLPANIALKFKYWADLLETYGMDYVRKIPGFHDEPLLGKRQGQRSVRLSRTYRVIYEVVEGVQSKSIKIMGINKHDY